MPLGVEYIQETTVFREYGPLAGNTVRLGYEYAPKIGNFISRQTADVDARYYMRLATNGVLAFRARGFKSWGEFPGYLYFGGNSELRGYDYLEFLGNKAFFANAELRFPLIEAALTPLGVIGGLRGVALRQLRRRRLRRRADARCGRTTRSSTRRCSASSRTRRRWSASTPVFGPTQQHRRLQAGRRPRVVRHRPRDVRARLPDPLRLVVAHAVQQGLRRLRVRLPGARSRARAAATGSASRSSRSGSATTSRRASRHDATEDAMAAVPVTETARTWSGCWPTSSSSSCRRPSTPRSNGTSRRARAASRSCGPTSRPSRCSARSGTTTCRRSCAAR